MPKKAKNRKGKVLVVMAGPARHGAGAPTKGKRQRTRVAGGTFMGKEVSDVVRNVKTCPSLLSCFTNDTERIPADLLQRPASDASLKTVVQRAREVVRLTVDPVFANVLIQVVGGSDDRAYRTGSCDGAGVLTWQAWVPWTARLNSTFFEGYFPAGAFVSVEYTGAYGSGVSGRAYALTTSFATACATTGAEPFTNCSQIMSSMETKAFKPQCGLGASLPPRHLEAPILHLVGGTVSSYASQPVFTFMYNGAQLGASMEVTVTQTYECTLHPIYARVFTPMATMFETAKKAEKAQSCYSQGAREALQMGPQPLGFFDKVAGALNSAAEAVSGFTGAATAAHKVYAGLRSLSGVIPVGSLLPLRTSANAPLLEDAWRLD